MKLFRGWTMSAGLVVVAATAQAQTSAPYQAARSPTLAVSDVDGPYAAMPPEATAPGFGPMLLPPREVYTILRENGFSPLGIPQARGPFYTIAVIDRGGEDGRLLIDARNGQIVRFVPASRFGGNFNGDLSDRNGPVAPPPPIVRGVPRPPAPVPHLASRTPSVPLPKASPPHADDVPRVGEVPRADHVKPQAARPAPAPEPGLAPEPPQQSAAVQAKPAEPPTTPPAAPAAAPAPVQAKPAPPPIQPTQPMPLVQGLE